MRARIWAVLLWTREGSPKTERLADGVSNLTLGFRAFGAAFRGTQQGHVPESLHWQEIDLPKMKVTIRGMRQGGDGRIPAPLGSLESEEKPPSVATDVSKAWRGTPLGNAALSNPGLVPRDVGEQQSLISQPAAQPERGGGGVNTPLGAGVWSILPSQMHLTWTCFVLRSSRQCSHWVTGRPFFFISKRGRSKCLHEEDRWPFMQVSLDDGHEQLGEPEEPQAHTKRIFYH